ncbi:MAG TPA: nuclear transport factor 2 family protein [Gemmatimonadales bacterium]|nr:nuclear transport factor 2 family protein [Gemmatimonadales bacterium]
MQKATIVFAVLTVSFVPHAWTQEPERAAVLATVQKVFDGMRTRDTVLIQQAFDTSARLLRVTSGPAPSLRGISGARFAAIVRGAKEGDVWNERIYDPEVRVDGNIAQVWAYYTFHLNATFTHCGIDAFMLMKLGNTWKITQLTDTEWQQGCTHTEARD